VLIPQSDERRIVAATERDGIFFSDDSGQTWLRARAPEGDMTVRSLVALGPRLVAAVTPASLLLSWDGTDFSPAPLPDRASAIHGLVATDRGLLAATSRGVLRSDGHGTAWRRLPGLLDGSTVSAICKHPTRPGVLFASRYGGIYRSLDGGNSWAAVVAEGELQAIEDLVVTDDRPGALFAVTRHQGVYVIPLEPSIAPIESSVAGTTSEPPRRSHIAF
jgi:photosystem II stability/assembly factor-like uncharacterized protein